MKNPTKTPASRRNPLTDPVALTAAVEVLDVATLPPPLAKAVKQLDRQLVKYRRQVQKPAKPAPSAAKVARKALAAALLGTLKHYWGAAAPAEEKALKALNKTLKRMAGKLLKQHARQQKEAPVKTAATPKPRGKADVKAPRASALVTSR